MAASPPALEPRTVALQPAGCDQCGSTSLQEVGGGKFQCVYCGAFTLEREPPPLPEAPPGADPNRPPPTRIHQVSAIEVLSLDARGLIAAPPDEEIGKALDRRGPKGFYRPSPLSRHVKLVKATGHAPIRLEVRAFVERRRYEEAYQPYSGQAPVTTPLPPLWSAPLRPATEETTRRIPVEGQQSVTTCPRCRGSATVTCFTCGGGGEVECSLCHGGVDVSNVLGGGGSGQRCVQCGGRGKVRCSACGGGGSVTCDVCGGATRVLQGWERVEELALETASHTVSDGRDWSHYLWMQRAEGQLVFDRDVPGRLDLTETDGPIAKLADQIVLDHNHAIEGGYAYWTRLTVTKIPVVEVAYEIRGTAGTLHIYGRDQRISMPGKKPIGCGGCLLWAVGMLGAAAALSAALLF